MTVADEGLRLSHDEVVTCVDGWNQSQGTDKGSSGIPDSPLESVHIRPSFHLRENVSVKIRCYHNIVDPAKILLTVKDFSLEVTH